MKQAVERAISRWDCELEGIIHLAGVASERLSLEETRESLAATLRPKMLGTWVLHQLIKEHPNKIFISFSSLTSFFGGVMVGSYAAANRFLDHFSHYQRYQCGLQSYCFAWGMWDGLGLSRGSQAKDLLQAKGYKAIPAIQGLHSLIAGLFHRQEQLLIGLDASNWNIQHYTEMQTLNVQTLKAYYTTADEIFSEQLVNLGVCDSFSTPTTCKLQRLQALPLTSAGEIDRDRLEVMERKPASESIKPRNDLEVQLTKIWENVLGKKPIGVKDNFFELGGHSLLAVRLLAQIEKAFEKNLPLATLFQAPTVEQLANTLRQKGWSAPCQTLVTIQPGDSKPPLFFIHVLGEGLKFCRPLTSHLDPEQPIYGLAVGIMDEVSLNKVDDVVGHYIKEMRSIQPEGPYLLAGIYCGGRVAYEMALQLHTQGQKVALLALVDTLKDGEAIKIIPVKERVLAHWKNLLRLGPAYLLNKRRLGEVKNRLMSIYCEFYERLGLPSPQACQSFTYRKKKEEGNMEWVFAPKEVYPDRVTLFRAIENMGFIDHDLGWSELAPGGLEIHDVPGDTFSMLEEPHIQVLAKKLRDCIDRVQGDDLADIPPREGVANIAKNLV
jgi:thioesterase domain-containing protein/acyl carrier protein